MEIKKFFSIYNNLSDPLQKSQTCFPQSKKKKKKPVKLKSSGREKVFIKLFFLGNMTILYLKIP